MEATFNLGIGMVAVVAVEAADTALSLLGERGVDAWVAGAVTAGAAQGVPSAWSAVPAEAAAVRAAQRDVRRSSARSSSSGLLVVVAELVVVSLELVRVVEPRVAGGSRSAGELTLQPFRVDRSRVVLQPAGDLGLLGLLTAAPHGSTPSRVTWGIGRRRWTGAPEMSYACLQSTVSRWDAARCLAGGLRAGGPPVACGVRRDGRRRCSAGLLRRPPAAGLVGSSRRSLRSAPAPARATIPSTRRRPG